jgi:hypothetical protein
MILYTTPGHITKRKYVTIEQKCLHIHVHCMVYLTIHNNQTRESIQGSTIYIMNKV